MPTSLVSLLWPTLVTIAGRVDLPSLSPCPGPRVKNFPMLRQDYKMLVRSLVGFSDGLGFWFTCISNAAAAASLAQLIEHALRKRMVTGSIPVGGYVAARMHRSPACN